MRQQAVVPGDRAASPWARTAVAAVAVVVLVVGFIALASALSSADTSFIVAQLVSRDDDARARSTLVATGYGRASAPAETATLQLVISPSGDQFNGGSFRPTPGATEEAGDETAAMPFVDAIQAREINRDAIDVVVSPIYGNSPFYGGAPLPGFRIDIHLANPTSEQLNALVTDVYHVARESGWYVADQGVIYAVEDCATLEWEARSAAVENARQQALQQADVLDAALGELVQIADAAPGHPEFARCSGPEPIADMTTGENPFGASQSGAELASRPYDPAAPPEVIVEFRVELTYALPEE